ncbi:MAG: protein serine/threonine phosphatase 2C family protein [Armatimonadetes bacterium]|nr:protein serine/threonine phosphatase 2C family protein [Armatimonadota bacterium]
MIGFSFNSGRKEPEAELPLPPVRQVAGQLTVDAYGISSTGGRPVNEDSYLCQLNPPVPSWLGALMIVADGIGGRGSGHIASSLAVRAARDTILATDRFYTPSAVCKLLLEAFCAADRSVYAESLENPELAQMGTTLVIALVAQRRLFVASLGDSRLYLHRGRRLVPLTEDDWTRAPAEPGLGDPPSVAGRQVTLVNRAIGWNSDPDPVITDHEIGVEDIVLLCTDGLTDAATDRQIEAQLHKNRKRMDMACRSLLDIAEAQADSDNVTVIAARIDRH